MAEVAKNKYQAPADSIARSQEETAMGSVRIRLRILDSTEIDSSSIIETDANNCSNAGADIILQNYYLSSSSIGKADSAFLDATDGALHNIDYPPRRPEIFSDELSFDQTNIDERQWPECPVENDKPIITCAVAKPRLTKEEHYVLESHFQKERKPSTPTKRSLAETLAIPVDNINNWFQNRRAADKLKSKTGTKDATVEGMATCLYSPLPATTSDIRCPTHPALDWNFITQHGPKPKLSTISTCPSLTSGSTSTSRNSSTRSTKSLRWTERDSPARGVNPDILSVFDSGCSEDLESSGFHSLTNSTDRPIKCPIQTCEYHLKGFARAYDQMRHTCTHYKGRIVCGFCPGSGTTIEKAFNRHDVFSRHLLSVHGAHRLPTSSTAAKQMSPSRRTQAKTRRGELYKTGEFKKPQKPFEREILAQCTLCSLPFDPQGMYEHLLGCVLRCVTEGTSAESNEPPRIPMEFNDPTGNARRTDSVITRDETTEIGATTSDCLESLDLRPEASSTPEPATSSQHDTKTNTLLEPNTDNDYPSSSARSSRSTTTLSETDDLRPQEITTPSRCPSPTTSDEINSSDEETDWTEDTSALSPQSEPDVRIQPVLSPIKHELIDEIMKEFHLQFDKYSAHIQSCNGESSHSSSQSTSRHSSSSGSSADSSHVSRKRSLSNRSTPPPNRDGDNGDDPNKRRRPDSKRCGKDAVLERRFACPYYKRNPGRHQTFTSCRDPGFNTVARLKEHLYRRHLLPIQCNRCCSTFPNEPSLREHQRDPRGCEIQEQIPLEGFDKDQERKLKSKKRNLGFLTEEDKWKGVYRILFPDDNEENMPSPYIDYRVSSENTLQGESSNITRFQEFSRLELPRLVRRTLEIVVEQEAQPLEEKLKDRLVDIVKEC